MLSFNAYPQFVLKKESSAWTLCFRHAVQAAVVNLAVGATLTEDYFGTICDACSKERQTDAPWNPLEG